MLVFQYLLNKRKELVAGRQEDAHEFLRSAMEDTYLMHISFNDELETTPLNKIFSDYATSSVRCSKCKNETSSSEHFQDLMLDISTVVSLEKD